MEHTNGDGFFEDAGFDFIPEPTDSEALQAFIDKELMEVGEELDAVLSELTGPLRDEIAEMDLDATKLRADLGGSLARAQMRIEKDRGEIAALMLEPLTEELREIESDAAGMQEAIVAGQFALDVNGEPSNGPPTRESLRAAQLNGDFTDCDTIAPPVDPWQGQPALACAFGNFDRREQYTHDLFAWMDIVDPVRAAEFRQWFDNRPEGSCGAKTQEVCNLFVTAYHGQGEEPIPGPDNGNGDVCAIDPIEVIPPCPEPEPEFSVYRQGGQIPRRHPYAFHQL